MSEFIGNNAGYIMITSLLCLISHGIGYGRDYYKAMKYCTEALTNCTKALTK